jgi:hypothetical protein
MRERFAGLRVLRIVPGRPAHSNPDKTASASPLRWGRFFKPFRAPGTLSGPRLSWRGGEGNDLSRDKSAWRREETGEP